MSIYKDVGCSQEDHLANCGHFGMSGTYLSKHAKGCPAGRNAPCDCNPTARAKCWCHTCRPVTMSDMRMVLCPTCGNKRCPKANHHRNACTNSNEPGQKGSAYE